MTPEKQKKYDEKLNRLNTAIAHGEPDRVPVSVGGGIYAVVEAGYTVKECIYDTTLEKAVDAAIQFENKYDTDTAQGLIGYAGEGPIMDLVAPRFMAWSGRPGYNVPDNSIQQFMEDPSLKDEDMEQFFNDNGAWRVNKCQPNLCYLYEPLRKFNIPFSSRTPAAFAEALSTPDMREMIQTCWKISDMYKEFRPKAAAARKKVQDEGFPSTMGGKACVPYDEWGDEYRGSLQCLTDLYEYPDEVERFIAANQEEMIAKIKSWNKDGSKTGKTVMMTLHRGMDGFLSDAHYRDIYWKHLQEIIEAIMSVDMVPDVFCEGHYETRLDLLRDVPKGKIIYAFEYTPLDLAKKTVGDIATISGGIHTGLLSFGTVEQVKDATKKCIDDAAYGGGYMFRTTASLDFAKPENVEAMFDVLHTYGKK